MDCLIVDIRASGFIRNVCASTHFCDVMLSVATLNHFYSLYLLMSWHQSMPTLVL